MRRKKGYFPGTISLMLSHRLASQPTCANTLNRLKTHIPVKVTPRNDKRFNSEIVLITIMLLLKMYCGKVVSIETP